MDALYRITFDKLFNETIGNDEAHNFKAFEFKDVVVRGEKMNVFFCKNEKGMFVIAGKFWRGAPHRSCGHWHGGTLYLDVYFRKNFSTKEEGNEFYRRVKETKTI